MIFIILLQKWKLVFLFFIKKILLHYNNENFLNQKIHWFWLLYYKKNYILFKW